jgi:acetyltransferase-like isoleucine patch superfamily enzyme
MESGSYLNKGSVLEGRNYIGRDTCLSNVRVGYGSVVNRECDLANTVIGKYTSLGSRVTTELGSHPLDGRHVALHTAFYSTAAVHGYTYAVKDTYSDEKYLDENKHVQVVIGNDVWIGNNVSIVEGATIGDGAAIAAGSVVTGNIDPYGIYGGVPAKKIRSRFPDDSIASLLKSKWWDKDESELRSMTEAGLFDDVMDFIK